MTVVHLLLLTYRWLIRPISIGIVMLFIGFTAQSQDSTNVFVKTLHSIDSLVTESLSSEGGIIPAPVFNSSMGTGIAVLPVYVYRLKGVHPETRPSTSQGILFFNLAGNFLVGAKQTLYFNRNKYWLDVYAGYSSMSFKHFYNNSDEQEEVKFDGFISSISFAFLIKNNFFIGPMMSNNYLREELPDRYNPLRVDAEYYWYHVPGIKLAFDSRDNLFYPESGWFNTLTYETMIHNPANNFNFDKITLGIANYIGISKKRDMLIASRLFTQLGIGLLPLHEMASPGATPVLRGYITGNYLNSSMVTVQTELRWMYSEKWGCVGFMGYGWLFDEPRTARDGITLPSIGAGIRYRIFPEFKINLGFDVAVGRDGSANVYLKMSESF